MTDIEEPDECTSSITMMSDRDILTLTYLGFQVRLTNLQCFSS